MMQPSERLIAAIKEFEGFRPMSYADAVGVRTIGYGETHGVQPGQVISEPEADLMLRGTLAEVAAQVDSVVNVSLTQGQFDALCDFVYNEGIKHFAGSRLLKELNDGNYNLACDQFAFWKYAGGKILPGLIKRRAMEMQWWNEHNPPVLGCP